MRRFIGKLFLLSVPVLLWIGLSWFIDPFNIFHWDAIRITSAEPNRNYVKTRYLAEHPDKFNAFVFGTSRAGSIPLERLPREAEDGTELRWYNLFYSMGLPAEHTGTLKTLLGRGAKVKAVVLLLDEMPMGTDPADRGTELLRRPYQDAEKDPCGFYKPYLTMRPPFSLLREVLSQDTEYNNRERDLFYRYGVSIHHLNYTLPEAVEEHRFTEPYTPAPYAYEGVKEDVAEFAALCKDNGISLTVLTAPLMAETYADCVRAGYLRYLRDISEVCPFYSFSELNMFSADKRYYLDSMSHFSPALGMKLDLAVWGSDEERENVRLEAAGGYPWESTFGRYIAGPEDADCLIADLRSQLEKAGIAVLEGGR